MKKRFLFTLVSAIFVALNCFAQGSLVATLNSGANIQAYYGEGALVEAYAAANDGDVITLSSGVFTAVDIEKAITIRGAGMFINGATSECTRIAGDMSVNVPNVSKTISLEGLCFLGKVYFYDNNLSVVNILKSSFNTDVDCRGCNPRFYSCFLYSRLKADTDSNSNSTAVYCQNCYVHEPYCGGYNSGSGASSIELANCVIGIILENYSDWNLPYGKVTNSILLHKDGHSLSPTCTASHNIAQQSSNAFARLSDASNQYVEDINSIFKDLVRYELTDEAAATYLGDDGTQLGIHGGANPFNEIPTNPRVRKFNVKSETTDGVLTVKIDVE